VADQYHKVIEMRARGFDEDRVYMATNDDLLAKGWKPSHEYVNNLESGNVFDEEGQRFCEAVDGWDALGNDAWVSEKAYPQTTRIKIQL
jgi:hypothetical protein